MKPLLSFVMSGRNDNYTPDFLYRLSTTINFLSESAKQSGKIDQIEIIIVDWSSEQKLKDHVQLSECALSITQFIYIPDTYTDQYHKGVFSGNLGPNIALRRAQGKFVSFCGAEVLIPASSVYAMCQLADGKLPVSEPNEKLYVCGRYRLPSQWVMSQPTTQEWQKYLENNSWRIVQEPGRGSFLTGNAGLLLIPRKMLHQSQGLLQDLDPYWGWNDVEYTSRVLSKFPCVDLNSNGVTIYDMEHFNCIGDRQTAVKKPAPRLLCQSFAANDKNWGAGDTEFCIEYSEKRPMIGFKQDFYHLVPGVSIDRFNQFSIWMADNLTVLPDQQEIQLLATLFHYFKQKNILFFKEYGINQGHTFYLFAFMFKHCHLIGIDNWREGGGEYGVDHIAYNLTTSVMDHLGHLRLINRNLIDDTFNSLALLENNHHDGVVICRVEKSMSSTDFLTMLKNDFTHHHVVVVGKYAKACLNQTELDYTQLVENYAYIVSDIIDDFAPPTEISSVEILLNRAVNVSCLSAVDLLSKLDQLNQIVLWGNNELSRLISAYKRDDVVKIVNTLEDAIKYSATNEIKIVRTF